MNEIALFTPASTAFAKRGIIIALGLLCVEHVLFSLFYAHADTELWTGKIAHKYVFYVDVIVGVVCGSLVAAVPQRAGDIQPVSFSYRQLTTFTLQALGLSLFVLGVFVISEIVRAGALRQTEIISFIDHNLLCPVGFKPMASC